MEILSYRRVTVVISLHLFVGCHHCFAAVGGWCAWYVSTSFPMRATCQAACVFIYIKTIVPVPVLLFLTVPCADLRPERFGLFCHHKIKFRCSRLFSIFTCRITVRPTPSLIPINLNNSCHTLLFYLKYC